MITTRLTLPLTCTLALMASPVSPVVAGSMTDAAPPGPHFKLNSVDHEQTETFAFGTPIIGTTYFYWYDVYTAAHIRDPDGTDALTTHPPIDAMGDLSYKSSRWHYTQLRDMSQAGIDFLLPVYWGIPGDYEHWSIVGLPPLIAAHDRMIAEHQEDSSNPLPPKIGMFYDTSTLRWNQTGRVKPGNSKSVDLTTNRGREWFYVTIRDFFSLVPPDKWARIDGRPIVFLYLDVAADADDKLFDDLRKRFEADFGTDLFLVRHVDWPGSANAWYRWGGAVRLTIGDHVAGLGPGYDHTAVPGRQPLVIERQRGKFYNNQWQALLRMNPRRRPWMVHIETWNEWHEGTDIARSQEHGDLYIKATAQYAELFHAGTRLERSGPFLGALRVRWSGRAVGGLYLQPAQGDGHWTYRDVNGVRAVVTVGEEGNSQTRYLYFDVDDSYAYDEQDRIAEVTVVFRDDGGCKEFQVQYDNSNPEQGPQDGAFRASRSITVENTGTWRTAALQLPDVRFCNRTHRADLRLAVSGGARDLTVREVIVRLLPGTLIRGKMRTGKEKHD